jgi:hypothetical protein
MNPSVLVKRADRIEWLLANPKLWEGFPSGHRSNREIILQMKKDGVLSRKTSPYDVDLRSLVIDARRLRADRALKGTS